MLRQKLLQLYKDISTTKHQSTPNTQSTTFKMLTLKEFIDRLPETTAYRLTLVRLFNQISEMKQRDAEFLRQEKNKLQKRLADVCERQEKQASDWIDRMLTGAVLKVVSSFSSLLCICSNCVNESTLPQEGPPPLPQISGNSVLKSSCSIPFYTTNLQLFVIEEQRPH